MNHNDCWNIINKAEVSTIEWSKEKGNPIFKIEFVATFEDWDNGIGVYIFFRNDKDKEKSESTGFHIKIKQYYLHLLEEFTYPFDKFPYVIFIFDSDENVRRKYEGSYFFRLR